MDYLNDLSASNYLASMANQPAPVAPVPVAQQTAAPTNDKRSSFWQELGRVSDILLRANGRKPIYQAGIDEQAAREFEARKRQMEEQKLQSVTDDAAVQKITAVLPALEDAYQNGGMPALQAAWQQQVAFQGIDPAKAQQFSQMISANPEATLRQMRKMIPAEKQGSLPSSIQELQLLQSLAPEQVAALPPLARARLEAMANPNAIKPDQAADNSLAAARFRYTQTKDAADFKLRERALQIAADRAAAAKPGKDSLTANSASDVGMILRDFGIQLKGPKDPVADLIKGSTSGYIENAASMVPGILGSATKGQQNIAKLKTIDNAVVLSLAGGKLGAGVSNADRDFFKEMSGKISDPNTPAGARLAAWGMIKARLAGIQSRSTHPNRPTITPRAGPTPVRNDAEYARLPSGAVFVGPDGKTRRKP